MIEVTHAMAKAFWKTFWRGWNTVAPDPWRDISTLTPEHLEVVLGSAPRQLVGEGRLSRPENVENFGKFPGWDTYYFGEPTHWMPLPPPPKAETGAVRTDGKTLATLHPECGDVLLDYCETGA